MSGLRRNFMIVTVTLNPALDKIIFLDKLIKKHNNRAKEIIYDIGGKATHVSVVLSSMEIENISTGILAGENGKRVQRLLEAKGVKCDYTWQKGDETRESYIVLPRDEEGSYMITQRGFAIKKDTFENFKKKLEGFINKDDIVVFSGGPPPQITVDMYRELLEIVKHKKGKLIVDVSREYLKEAIKIKPYLIKPNEMEFREIMDKDITSEQEYIEEIKKLNDYGVEIVALSLGKEGSIISTSNKKLRMYPPKIKEVNDTGCGDVFLGGAVAMIFQNKGLEETFRFATAISASKATKERSSDFSLNEARELLKEVRIELI
jgi:1-phosphofructokinase family hexose kinase